MASLYLLDNPDHYTSHELINFWWCSFVADVAGAWNDKEVSDFEGDDSNNSENDSSTDNDDDDESDSETIIADSDNEEGEAILKSKKVYRGGGNKTADTYQEAAEEDAQKLVIDTEKHDKVVLKVVNDKYIGMSNTDDYKHRPLCYANMSLYEWIQTAEKKRRTPQQQKKFMEHVEANKEIDHNDDEWQSDELYRNTKFQPFKSTHPLYLSHEVVCHLDHLESHVPNFAGGVLPRCDVGDYSYYCMSMLTFFRPWRSGKDLKEKTESWEEAFSRYEVKDKAKRLMLNFNLRYECLDAQDDFHAQLKKRTRAVKIGKGFSGDITDSEDEDNDEDYVTVLDGHDVPTRAAQKRASQMAEMSELCLRLVY